VSLNIDTWHPMRRPSELEALVRAVLDAVAEDEAEWIEWKSNLALDNTEGWFSISKQVLGMANRNPERAARFVGGLGYLVVGVEPARLLGVNPVDVAKLDAYLQRYLGSNGPVWAPTYLTVDGKTVLVVVVEAPVTVILSTCCTRLISLLRARAPTRAPSSFGAKLTPTGPASPTCRCCKRGSSREW
jgi:hypothetical protein